MNLEKVVNAGHNISYWMFFVVKIMGTQQYMLLLTITEGALIPTKVNFISRQFRIHPTKYTLLFSLSGWRLAMTTAQAFL